MVRVGGATAGADGREDLALFLLEFLPDLAHDLRRTLEPALRHCGLVSGLQVAVLGVLRRTGPSRLVDVGRRLNLPGSTLSELVDRLVAEGLLERTPNPHDRRSVLLEVTSAGGASLAEVRRLAAAAFGRVLRRLDDETVEGLVCGLRGLRAAVDAEHLEGERGAAQAGGAGTVVR